MNKLLILGLIILLQLPAIAQTKRTDDNLFPTQVTNPITPGLPGDPSTQLPGDPNNPNIPGLPSIPGLPTIPSLPSLPGSIPIGGSGSGFNSIFPGGGGNTQMQIAQVPNEFYCPLFESNPYDSIFRALDALTSSMRMNPECQQQQNQYSDFYADSEKIRNLILQLQQYQQSPDLINGASTRDIERVIQDAVSGVTNIANNLSNNKLINKNCGLSRQSAGKALLAINDILNNLAPVALVIAAANPAIGVATKVALLGGVYATSAIKGFDTYMTQNTLDLTNPEIRKAILQNTCQFVKVRQKIDFLQLGEEGRLGDIKNNLFKDIQAYRARYTNPSSNLLPLMQYKYQTEKIITDLEAKLVEDKYNLNFYNSKIKNSGSDKERVCLTGMSLVKNSKDAETFPASALRILETAVEASKLSGSPDGTNSGIVDPKVQTDSDELYLAFTKSRNRLNSLTAKALGDGPDADKSILLCANETEMWIKRIYEIVIFSERLVNKEIKEVEDLLTQSDEYKIWNAQYVKLKSETRSIDKVIKVLKEMNRPDAVYIRSELDQRSRELKSSLFRSNNVFGIQTFKSPVLAWLDNNLEMHERSIREFSDYIKLLQKGSYGLSNITLKSVPQNTRPHEVACQQLKEAYLKFKASRDYLGSAEFMCDMIDPFLNDTSDQIIATCRGGKTYSSAVKSKIEQRKESIKTKSNPRALSLDDYGKIVNLKRVELKCPLPSVAL